LIPPPGFVILSVDFVSQEPRIAASLSGDHNMIKWLQGDPYMTLVTLLFPEDPEVKKYVVNPEEYLKEYGGNIKRSPLAKKREIAKIISLSLLYGAVPETWVSKSHGLLSLDDAKSLYLRLRKLFEIYFRYEENIRLHYINHRVISTPHDQFPLLYPPPKTAVTRWKETYALSPHKGVGANHTIQGAGAELLRRVVPKLMEAGYDVLHMLHDGVYILAPECSWEEVYREVDTIMCSVAEELFPLKPLNAEWKTSLTPNKITGLPYHGPEGIVEKDSQAALCTTLGLL
jgi:hypothetical protein